MTSASDKLYNCSLFVVLACFANSCRTRYLRQCRVSQTVLGRHPVRAVPLCALDRGVTCNASKLTLDPFPLGQKTANLGLMTAGHNDAMDTLAEWLRRRPAKPMGSPRVGSNPTGVVSCAGGAVPGPRRLLHVFFPSAPSGEALHAAVHGAVAPPSCLQCAACATFSMS